VTEPGPRRDHRAGRAGKRYPPLSGGDAELVALHLGYMRLRGLAIGTMEHRRRALTRLAASLRVPLIEATAGQLADWRAALPLGAAATLSEITNARQFYEWLAMYARLRPDNPAAQLIRPKRGRRLPRPIAEADLMHALGTAEPHIRIWLVLAAWAGLRAKEIALLRRANVLDRDSQPALLIAADATKGATERLVPIGSFVHAELAAYGLPASGWMFRRLDGKPGPNTPARVSQACNAHLHSLGIAATLHQLRHRFGTQAYRAKKDLRAVQELMGHADPATTAVYTAYDLDSAIETVDSIPVPPGAQAIRLQIVGQAS